MKKISVLLIMALLFCTIPCEAGVFNTQKARIEQNRIYKSELNAIKNLIKQQTKHANNQNLDGLAAVYSDDFVNTDGLNKEIYLKLVEETWTTYPDIFYTTYINSIEISDNYASVFVTETAVAAPKEELGDFEVVGELYSTSRCIYHLKKNGSKWLIQSEKVIDEVSTLKYGEARYIDMVLDAPRQIGAGKYYTAALKVDAPEESTVVAAIGKENIVYPPVRAEDVFRRFGNDNRLERVFLSNTDNVNEYAVASVGLSQTESYDEEHIRIYMSGLAFIMTRINVIPENKFVNMEQKNGKDK